QANRAKSANNLTQLACAGIMATNVDLRGGGRFPMTAGELLKQDISPMVFVNPRKGSPPPPPFANQEEAARWVDEHSDYVWVGGGLNVTHAGAEDVIAYEKPEGL